MNWSFRYPLYAACIELSIFFFSGFLVGAGFIREEPAGTLRGNLFIFLEESIVLVFVVSAIVFFLRRSIKADLSTIGLTRRRMWVSVGLGLLVGGIVWSIGGVLSWMMQTVFGEGWLQHEIITSAEATRSFIALLPLLGVACFTIPLGEEILVQGLAFETIKHRYGQNAAVFWTCAIILMYHLDPVYFPALIVLRLASIVLYVRTGSLVGPIIIHSLVNGINVVNVYLSTNNPY